MTVKQTLYSVLPAQLVTSSKGRALGPDLSRWEISYNPDLAINKADFAITKATEGLTWIDPCLDDIWKGIEKLDIRGLFHYQRSGMSWKAQADHFLTVSNNYDHHMLALDVEETNNVMNDVFFQDSYRILQYLRAKTSSKVLLYTSLNIFQNYLYPSWIRSFGKYGEEEAKTTPFWLAQYWYNPSPDKEPGTPKQRSTWNIWQWTENGNSAAWGAGAKAIDLNAYNGDASAMKSWLGISTSEVEPPLEPPIVVETTGPITEDQIWDATVITVHNVNVRSYPKLDRQNLTGNYVVFGQKFSGRLWVGNGFVWMQVISNDPSLSNKWVAVRSIAGDIKLIVLTKHNEQNPTPTTNGQKLWRVKHDIELGKLWRPGMPEVHPLFLAPKITSGTHFSPFQEWAQRLSRAANQIMTDVMWTSMYNTSYMLTNGQGYGRASDPRRNYILQKDLSFELPKVESLTCGGSLIEGTQYGDWVKVRGLNYASPISLDYFMLNPQFWTRGVYVTNSGNVYRMLGDKFPGTAFIHPLIVNTKYELWIQAYKLQEWTLSEIPDPLKFYSR